MDSFLAFIEQHGRREAARRFGISESMLGLMLQGRKRCGSRAAVRIEEAVGARGLRRDLRPADWWQLWPELVDDEHPIPQEAAA